MAGNILVLMENWKGRLSDVSLGLLALGREMADARGEQLCALLVGHEVKGLADLLGAADKVFTAEDSALSQPNAEANVQLVKKAWQSLKPSCLLAPMTNVSWDVISLLPQAVQAPFLASCRNVHALNGGFEVCSLLYGGKIEITVRTSPPVILGVLPGARSPAAAHAERKPVVEELEVGPLAPGRVRFLRMIEPEAVDVDISRQPVLVAVGRGIQSKENVTLADELATALGGTLCGSRPVIDQGWLPLSRQVGKSGATVKPRAYLSFGISGAPEHVEGMRDSELIIAVNTDPQAPIFDVAHYGFAGDALELLPALAEALAAKKA